MRNIKRRDHTPANFQPAGVGNYKQPVAGLFSPTRRARSQPECFPSCSSKNLALSLSYISHYHAAHNVLAELTIVFLSCVMTLFAFVTTKGCLNVLTVISVCRLAIGMATLISQIHVPLFSHRWYELFCSKNSGFYHLAFLDLVTESQAPNPSMNI